MIKNFIFDVDRTLIDSYQPELETLKEALYIVTRRTYSNEAMEKLPDILCKNDTILIKGSHSMNLSEITEFLKNMDCTNNSDNKNIVIYRKP